MTSALSDTSLTSLTGTESDNQFAAQLIGKDIPIFVGGQALMGCRIIEGPFIRTTDDVGMCDMIVSPCMVATPGATRAIMSLNLNGTQSFTSSDGGATWTALGTVFSGVEISVRYGTEDQLPFDSSVSRYGTRAVPYRSHICIELKNIPLAPFANVIPFVSAYIHEADYVTRNDALLKLANYARFNDDECDFNVGGHDPFWIVIEKSTFIEYIQDLQKNIGRNWNIVLGDKLRVFESGSDITPITLTRSDIVADTIRFMDADPLTIPAERALGFIDTTRDNDFNSVKAIRARYPVALTASENSDNSDIPIGMAAVDARAAVNKSLLIDDRARSKFSCKAAPHMRGLRPGDIIYPNVDGAIAWPTGRVLSVARNAADLTIDIVAERVDLSLLAVGANITSDGGGPTASISITEGTTNVTTVTAAHADVTGAFSISGGVDAALFTIDADTGALAFASAPSFDDPLDADGNNTYVIVVKAIGNGISDTQVITVTVTAAVDSSMDDDTLLLLIE